MPASFSISQADRTAPLAWRLLAVPVVAVILVAGIWFTAGEVTNDFTASMVLTAVWIGVAGLVCLGIARARRDFRIPVLGAYLATALVVGIYLGSTTFLDDEVNERVATAGGDAGEATADRGENAGGSGRSGSSDAGGGQNVRLAEGRFEALAHPAQGAATAIELGDGGRVLTLTDFEVDNGPDLRVYLTAESANGGDPGDFEDLGALKGNAGNQQYTIPRDVDLGRYSNVVIWCRAFTVGFAEAPLGRN